MNKRSPLLDKAVALLRKYLSDSAFDRFPSVVDLAKKAGVSVYTISMAARRLARDGKLVVLEGRGIWRPGKQPARWTDDTGSDALPRQTPPATKHDRVLARLEHDIATGVYDFRTPLPLAKELCSRYDISPRGMKRVLDAFVARGILDVRKRSYHLRHQLHKPGKSALVMMVDAPESVLAVARIRFNSRLIDELEKQCRRQQVEFVLCAVTPEDEGCSGGLEKKLRMLEAEYAVLGYIVTGYYLANPLETISRICARRKPVAVIYEGRLHDEDVAGFSENAHAFLFDSGRPSGALVARHLLQLGHRSIAYVDYEVFDGIRPGRFEEIDRMVTNAGGRVTASRITSTLGEKMDSCFADAAREIALRMQAEKLCSPHDRTLERRIREKLLKNSSGEIFRVNLHNALDRLFEKELFTAIVGGGVSTPVFILEYLNLKKIAVPAQMSLAGFGNSLAESENGITSFDCDCYSVAHAIVWHLLRPEQKKSAANNRHTVIEGVLMPRMSTSATGDG